MKPLLWIAVPLLLGGAVLLVAGIGAPGLWIAVIAVGVALVVIGRRNPGSTGVWRRADGPGPQGGRRSGTNDSAASAS